MIYALRKIANKKSSSLHQSPSHSREDVNSPSDNKEEDEGSEDESDERMDQTSYDPERLKAFNVSLDGFKFKLQISSQTRRFKDFSIWAAHLFSIAARMFNDFKIANKFIFKYSPGGSMIFKFRLHIYY